VSVLFVLRIAREAPKKLYEVAIVVAIALGESMAFQDREACYANCWKASASASCAVGFSLG